MTRSVLMGHMDGHIASIVLSTLTLSSRMHSVLFLSPSHSQGGMELESGPGQCGLQACAARHFVVLPASLVIRWTAHFSS